MDILQKQFRVPEIYGDFWFNSDPIPLGALRGYVILISFWDYTSLSSVRALPYLQEWHRRYAAMGLVTIGVHSPEFTFGRDPSVVRKAIHKLGIRFPVVMDNDFLIWSAFRNRTWPTHYLVDKNGFIRYIQQGEGSYQNFEHSIQSLIVETGYHGEFPVVMEPLREIDRQGMRSYRATPVILAGYQRGTLGNVAGAQPESSCHYDDPGMYLEGRIYLEGDWFLSRDYAKLQSSEGKEGASTVMYNAKEVYAVIKPEGESNFQVFVQQDEKYLTADNKGDDVKIDSEQRSHILVKEPKLFHLVKNPEFAEHKLRLITRSNGFALYSFSFVSSIIPELISNN
jgi:hypothetical protein